eukprot:4677446-Alexandrium_andersonii.AAC.1
MFLRDARKAPGASPGGLPPPRTPWLAPLARRERPQPLRGAAVPPDPPAWCLRRVGGAKRG